MNRLSKLFSYTVIAVFAGMFFSCSNLLEQNVSGVQSENQAKAAFLKVSVGSRAARTVMPSFGENNFTDLVLKGTKAGGEEQTLGTWESVSAMQNAVIPVTSGFWTFTLTAKNGGTSLSGTLPKTITLGENELNFTLSISEIGNAAGSFSITLNFADAQNADKVTKAVATLENTDGSAVSGISTQTFTPPENSVTFSATGIAAGTYRAKVIFYTTENGTDLELATYRELVQISSDLASIANRTIENFDELYTVTYDLNGGTLSEGVSLQETVTRKSDAITLPSLTRDYYTFDGWYTDENFAEGTEVTSLENFTVNVNVYAKFTPITYTITYVLNGGTNTEDAVTTYTVEDDVTLPTPSKAESAFMGWYKTENLSDAKMTVWSKRQLYEDITLYARWNVYMEVSTGSLGSTIKSLTSNTTIKVKQSGEFYNTSISSINEALKALAETNSNVLVTLDLTEFTRLKMDSSKNNFKYCTNLEGVIFYSNLNITMTELPEYAFLGCSRLESIEIPYGVKTIYSGTFKGCTSLKHVILPSTLTRIDTKVFVDCPSIESITFKDPRNWHFKNLKGDIYSTTTFDDPTGRNVTWLTIYYQEDYASWIQQR